MIPDILRLDVFNLITKHIGFVADALWHAQIVLTGKNVLLFKKLLEDNGFEDVSAVDMMAGVQLVGTPDKSPLSSCLQPPPVTIF